MGLSDAQTAQGLATFHRRSIKVVVQGIGHINALLAKMLKGNQIKWDGYGDGFDWWIRKLDETAEWSTGQLGTRTFEEKDPVRKASLAYCYLDRTYGIGEASIKSNRAAGIAKIYSIQAENARVAQSAIYKAITTALYSASDGLTASAGPAGLRRITGNTFDTSNVVKSAGAYSYAGIELNSSAITRYYGPANANFQFTNKYWAPVVFSAAETNAHGLTAEWSTHCFRILNWAINRMKRTHDVTGTGKPISPNLALMNTDPWNALWARLIANQVTYAIPISDEALTLANFTNIKVGPLTLVYDENVPVDAGDLEIVFVLDSKQFALETQNTKSEGLVEGQWDAKDVKTVGGVGVYKSNMGLRIDTPCSAAAITGCDA